MILASPLLDPSISRTPPVRTALANQVPGEPSASMSAGTEWLSSSAIPSGVPTHTSTGVLDVQLVTEQSSAIRIHATAPLKLLVPTPRGACVWAYSATFGGGLVAGDRISLNVSVGTGATLALGTQASTKVYRNDGRADAEQYLSAHIASAATLALVPAPVAPFAESRYRQEQRFHLAADASLLMIDGVTGGRLARGERWAFSRYRSRNRISVDGRLVIDDALALTDTAVRTVAAHMGRFQALATVVLMGPRFVTAANVILADIAARGSERHSDLLVTASPICAGCVAAHTNGCLVRLAASDQQCLDKHLRWLLAEAMAPLGDAWQRTY